MLKRETTNEGKEEARGKKEPEARVKEEKFHDPLEEATAPRFVFLSSPSSTSSSSSSQSATQGSVSTKLRMAETYRDGIVPDVNKALGLFREVAEQKEKKHESIEACQQIYEYYRRRDPVAATAWLRQLGYRFNAEANYKLGMMHKNGSRAERISKHEHTAYDFFSHARGFPGYIHVEAMLEYGKVCFAMALRAFPSHDTETLHWEKFNAKLAPTTPPIRSGFRTHYDEGFEALEIAAEHGSLEAEYELGNFYLRLCQIVSPDEARDPLYALALPYLRKCVEKGHEQATRKLAWMLQQGRGCLRDEKQAQELYKKADELKAAKQRERVAREVEAAIRGDREEPLAIFRTEMAGEDPLSVCLVKALATDSTPKSCYDLGNAYEYAEGGFQDLYAAYEWYDRAAKSGHKEAPARMVVIVNKLPFLALFSFQTYVNKQWANRKPLDASKTRESNDISTGSSTFSTGTSLSSISSGTPAFEEAKVSSLLVSAFSGSPLHAASPTQAGDNTSSVVPAKQEGRASVKRRNEGDEEKVNEPHFKIHKKNAADKFVTASFSLLSISSSSSSSTSTHSGTTPVLSSSSSATIVSTSSSLSSLLSLSSSTSSGSEANHAERLPASGMGLPQSAEAAQNRRTMLEKTRKETPSLPAFKL